ncbi:peptidase, C39 family [Leptospira ryugenii]|uniref:Peptidase, C39 family n=1 Tax=Leptospira ryugenii TaxID=1917863 RepID=A0A2P2E481_9LEPT|nr:peptidase domain-containing ABC transporter [Leptospira ryugenii]GBF51697.1 peptidase, C39 family [Leptospira ryugenii]
MNLPIALEEKFQLEEFLNSIPKTQSNLLLHLWERISLPKDQIIKAGDFDHTPILYVESGRIKVLYTQNSNLVSLRSLEKNSLYGIKEIALGNLDHLVYQASENSVIYIIRIPLWKQTLASNDKLQKAWESFQDLCRLKDEIRIIPLFRKLPSDLIGEIAQKLIKKQVKQGKTLIEEGSKSTSIFFISKGKFKIKKSTWPKDFFSIVEEGSVIGEMGVLEKKERNATVIAQSDAVVYELLAKDAAEIFQKSEALFNSLKALSTSRKSNDLDPSKEELAGSFLDEAFEDRPTFVKKTNRIRPRYKTKRFPMMVEESAYQSGQACRQMILKFYGYDDQTTEDDTFPNLDSEINFGHWKDTFSKYGETYVLDYLKYKKDLEDIPFLIRWEGSRFACVISKTGSKILVADPSQGISEFEEFEFEAKIGRYAILPIPTNTRNRRKRLAFSFFPGILRYFLPFKKFIISGLIASFLIKMTEIIIPLINIYLIDNVMIHENTEYLIPVIFSVACLTFVQILLAYFRVNVMSFSMTRANQEIVMKFLDKLISLPIYFFEINKKGEILKRWEEIENVITFFSEQGTMRFLDLVFAIITLILFIFLSPLLLMIILILLVPEIVLVSHITPLLENETKKESLRSADSFSYFIETIHGFETVKNLGSTAVQRWEFEKRLISQLNVEARRLYYSNLLESSTLIFKLITNILILIVGTLQVYSGEITIGTMFAVIGLISYLRSPMISLVKEHINFQKAKLAWKRSQDFYSQESEFEDRERISKIEIPDIQKYIEFRKVNYHFTHSKRNFNLIDINLKIEIGKRYAFVGRSGSGKSTFIKLILGLYKCSEGEVLIDGTSLEDIWLPSYRKRIGLVSQENPILAGSIRENISLSNPHATLSEITEAAKLADIHDEIIQLPLGYDTELNDRSNNFSEGQKQKIAFARLILQNPSLIVLDEPTSHLDKDTEHIILSNLYERMVGRTIVNVAHRLDTIRAYDEIIVVEQGRFVERGTHRDLIRKKGIYHLLYSTQEAIR